MLRKRKNNLESPSYSPVNVDPWEVVSTPASDIDDWGSSAYSDNPVQARQDWLDDWVAPVYVTKEAGSSVKKSMGERTKDALKSKTARRIGALGLAVAVAIPASAKTIEAIAPNQQQAEISASQNQLPNLTLPAPTPETAAHFQDTVAEACGEDVALRAAQINDSVFTESLPDATDITSLEKSSEQAVLNLDAARSHVSFYNLPPLFEELYDDADSESSQIPIATYEQFITDYLSAVGMKPMFEWNAASNVDQSIDTDTPMADGGNPLSRGEREESTALRQAIIGFAEAVSTTPKSLLKLAAREKVYFADFSNTAHFNKLGYVPMVSFLGLESSGGDYIAINANSANTTSIESVSTTSTHEAAHAMHLQLFSGCLADGFAKQNPAGFEYGEKTYKKLSQRKAIAGHSTVWTNFLETSATDNPAATYVPYSALSTYEDVATTAELLNPRNTSDLFEESEQNAIVFQKFAVFIAQMPEEETRDYIIAYLRVANYAQHAYKTFTSLVENSADDATIEQYANVASKLASTMPPSYRYW